MFVLVTNFTQDRSIAMGFFSKIISLFQSSETKKNIEDIEDTLLEAGLAPTLTYELVDQLSNTVLGKDPQEKITQVVKNFMRPILKEYSLSESVHDNHLEVVLMVGINGVGKTTTTAKLAYTYMHHYSLTPQSLLFCAADTFRAGAIEQLHTHANNLNINIIKQTQGADPSAVIFDGITHAKAKNIKKILIDTAGRMHTRDDLMQQLEKNYRVCLKLVPEEHIRVFITLDGNSGLNTVTQTEDFMSCLPIQATILTKYDGSTKGGALPSISYKTKLPCAFLGTGEKYQDLQAFNKEDFLHDFVSQ